MCRVAHLALAAALTFAQAAQAAGPQLPYFRFNLGHGPGTDARPPDKPVEPTDPTGPADPGEPDPAALRFAAAESIPSAPVSTEVAAAYKAAGGMAPYQMTLLDGPAGVRLARSTAEANAWVATGTLARAGTYPNARVRLVDRLARSVEFTTPLVVTERVAGIEITGVPELPESFPAGAAQQATASVSGAVEPVTMRIVGAAGTYLFQDLPGYGTDQSLVAVVQAPGTYGSAVLEVRDAAGRTASKPLRPFTVTPRTGPEMRIVGLEPLAGTYDIGAAIASTPFTVEGAQGSFTVTVLGAPVSFDWGDALCAAPEGTACNPFHTPYGDGADPGRWQAMGKAYAALAGSNAPLSVLAVDATGNSAVAEWGSVRVAVKPLTVVQQFPTPTTFDPRQFNQSVYGVVSGGTGNYDLTVGQDLPLGLEARVVDTRFCNSDFPCPVGVPALAPGQTAISLALAREADRKGTGPAVVHVRDTVTGEAVDFDPVTATVLPRPKLENC